MTANEIKWDATAPLVVHEHPYFAGVIKMEKVMKDGKEVIEWDQVSPPDAAKTVLQAIDTEIKTMVRKAVMDERERCAKVVEEFPHDQLGCLDEVAAAIRSGNV